jgi:WD40 repeat protein
MDADMSKNVPRCIINLSFLVFFLIFISPFSSLAQSKTHSVSLLDKGGNAVGFYRESHALLIGVSDYTGGWPRLPGVKKDVKLVREALQEQGFNVVLVRDPNRKQLIAAIEDFIHRYGQEPDNRLLFYYSGHGHTLKSDINKKMGYLVPVDAPNPSLSEKDFIAHSLDMSQINVYAKRIKSKHALFLFDSCFAGTLLYTDTASSIHISDKISRPVRQFITAGTEQEEVPDESIFRAQFISGLRGEADVDNDGYLTGTELGMFLENTVVTQSNALQHPTFWKLRDPKYDKGDFVFPLNADISPPIPTELAGGDIRGFTPASRGGMTDPQNKGKEILNRIRENFIRSLEVDDLKLCDPEVIFQAIINQAFDNGKSDLEFLKRLGNSIEMKLREELETLEQESAKTFTTVISTRKYSDCYQRILGHYFLSGWINGTERSRAIKALKKNSRSTRGFWKQLGESLGDYGKRVLGTTINKEAAGAMSGLMQSIYTQADDILNKTQLDVAQNTLKTYPQIVPEPDPLEEEKISNAVKLPRKFEPQKSPPSRAQESISSSVKFGACPDIQFSKKLAGHKGKVNTVSFSPDCKFIASGGSDGTVRIYNFSNGKLFQTLKVTRDGRAVKSISFSPDSKSLATGAADGTARVWDMETGNSSSLYRHRDVVNSVSFSPDGKYLATGSEFPTIRVLDITDRTKFSTLRGHKKGIKSVSFSPDGKFIASGSEDKTVRIWSTTSGKEVQSIPQNIGNILTVQFGPIGKYLATAGSNKIVFIWDVKSGKEIHSLIGHEQKITSLSFGPGGKYLATSSEDKTVRIWNLETGKEQIPKNGFKDKINSINFSPDGKYLVVGSDDSKIRIISFSNNNRVASLDKDTIEKRKSSASPFFAQPRTKNSTPKIIQTDSQLKTIQKQPTTKATPLSGKKQTPKKTSGTQQTTDGERKNRAFERNAAVLPFLGPGAQIPNQGTPPPTFKRPSPPPVETKPSEKEKDKLNDGLSDKEFFDKALKSVGISVDTVNKLKTIKVETFVELRKALATTNKGNLKGLSGQELVFLNRASLLFLLSNNFELNKNLAQQNINTLDDLLKLSSQELMKKSKGTLDETEATKYKNKITALNRLTDQQVRLTLVQGKNPLAKKEVGEQDTGKIPCRQCDTSTDLLSPAAYVLYLLDFMEKNLDQKFDKLEKINQRFKQRFEDLAISQEANEKASYVEYTNEILENLIAELNGKNWPNQIGLPNENRNQAIYQYAGIKSPKPMLAGSGDNNLFQTKISIYEEFKSEKYKKEPGFNSDVLEELFDSYVREFGTSRDEVGFIRLGSNDLQQTFVLENGLRLMDLMLIDKPMKSVTSKGVSYKDVYELKQALYAFFYRKLEEAVKSEFVSAIEDSNRIKFQRHFRKYKKKEAKKVFLNLIEPYEKKSSLEKMPVKTLPVLKAPITRGQKIFLKSEEYDRMLAKKKGEARTCVELGKLCPKGSEYENNPINSVHELFQNHASDYPTFKGGDSPGNKDRIQFAKNKLKDLQKKIEERAYKELLEEEQEEVSQEENDQNKPSEERIKQEAREYSEQRIQSEEEFDKQLRELAQLIFNKELEDKENRDSFNYAVRLRAKEKWKTSVSKAETGILSKIRSNLITIALKKIQQNPKEWGKRVPVKIVSVSGQDTVFAKENLEALANYLFLDLSVTEDYKTTPLSLAINRIHTLFQSIELKREQRSDKRVIKIGEKKSTAELNQEIWWWLRSYGTWHAAMMVTLYPENFLFPDVRRNQTHQFKTLVQDLEEGIPTGKAYENYLNSIKDLSGLTLVTAFEFIDVDEPDVRKKKKVFIFGFQTRTNQYYYSVLSGGEWIPWRPIPADMELEEARFSGFNGFKYGGGSRVNQVRIVYHDGYAHFLCAAKEIKTSNIENRANVLFSLRHFSLKINGNDLAETEEENADQEMDNNDSGVTWEEIDGIDLNTARKKFSTEGELLKPFNFLPSLALASRGVVGKAFTPGKKPEESSLKLGTKLLKAVLIFENNDTRRMLSNRNIILDKGKVYAINMERTRSGTKIGANFDYANQGVNKFLHGVLIVRDGYLHKSGYSPFLYNYTGSWYQGLLYYSSHYDLKTGLPAGTMGAAYANKYLVINNSSENYYLAHYAVGEKVFPRVFRDVYKTVVGPGNSRRTIRFTEIIYPIYKYLANGSRTVSGFTSGRKFNYTPALNVGNFWFKSNPLAYSTWSGKSYSQLSPPSGFPRTRVLNTEFNSMGYQDELELHAPMAIAQHLNENEKYEKAIDWIKKADEYLRFRNNFSYYKTNKVPQRAVGVWRNDPFNPYRLSDLHFESHQSNIKFAHVRNILDWADQLFVQDSSESVNRARELYELAGQTLGLQNWREDTCEEEWYAFGSKRKNLELRNAPILASLQNTEKKQVIQQVDSVLSSKACAKFKEARINSIKGGLTGQKTLNQIMKSPVKRGGTNNQGFRIQQLNFAVGGFGRTPIARSDTVSIGEEIPLLKEGFCIPVNPQIHLLRWRIESNLQKIGTNRNFAGFKRQLQPYATPVDPAKLVKLAASGSLEDEEFIPSSPPPIYRYSFLIERARYLISVAQQFQGSLLASLEKFDAESYNLLKAKQDIKLQRSNVVLQSLRGKEARDSLTQAEKQADKVEFIKGHYEELINGGVSGLEKAAIVIQGGLAVSYGVAAGLSLSKPVMTPAGPGVIIDIAGFAANTTNALAVTSGVLSTMAGFERREQEWNFQRDLADLEIDITEIGIDIARDRVNIVNQEGAIARLNLQQAQDTVEFLGNKFTNRDLYKWMSKTLRRIYRDQLKMALSTAKGAQRALEFERQSSFDFVGYDYWDDKRKGLLGSEKLLRDINKMDQFRLSSATRKKEVEKTISLASVAPVAFQQFKETGVLDFETLKEWFDRDFPGHYMRLIRDVNVSIFALIPPNSGIHATLSNPGISRIISGPPFEEPSIVYRLPESIALSGAQKATGLFELSPDDPMLLPFEGAGVATTWKLEMSRGANRFDYDTIADVLFTIRYTALDDGGHRTKVLQTMGQDESGYVKTGGARILSIRDEFFDQWYQLQNPVPSYKENDFLNINKDIKCGESFESNKSLPPHTMMIELDENDFMPNEEKIKVNSIILAMQKSGKEKYANASLKINLKFIPDSCSRSSSTNIKITSSGSTEKWKSSPYGKWVFSVDTSDTSNEFLYPIPVSEPDPDKVDLSWLEDLIMIIDYKAKGHYNR